MIPYIIAGLGSYFIGQSTTQKFADGGRFGLGDATEFQTLVSASDVSIYKINLLLGVSKDADVYDYASDCRVYYTLTPEITSWGLKDIYVTILKVEGTINWEADTEYLSQADKDILLKVGKLNSRGVIEGAIDVESIPFTLKSDASFSESGSFSINDVDIDCIDKKIYCK